MRIFIAIPCPEKVHAEFAQSLAVISAQLVATGHTVEVGICIGSYLAKNRRELSELFLKHDFDYLFWLDSDMKIPPDAGNKLLSHNVQIAACNRTRNRHPEE